MDATDAPCVERVAGVAALLLLVNPIAEPAIAALEDCRRCTGRMVGTSFSSTSLDALTDVRASRCGVKEMPPLDGAGSTGDEGETLCNNVPLDRLPLDW